MSKRKPFKPNKYLLELLKTNSDGYIKQTDELEENMLIALDYKSDTKAHLCITLKCTSRQFNVASANQMCLQHMGITEETKLKKIKIFYCSTTGGVEVVSIKDKKKLKIKENEDNNDTIL